MRIGYDAKRIVSNGTGLGSYGRTLINSLAALEGDDELLLYAPDEGRKEWREQVRLREGVRFVYSDRKHGLGKSLWRSHGIVEDLRRDGVSLYHGLSGELPVGLRKAGILGIVTIHDLIFMRHPEYYHAIDAWIYKRKFYQTLREADRIIAISERTRQVASPATASTWSIRVATHATASSARRTNCRRSMPSMTSHHATFSTSARWRSARTSYWP